MQRFFIYNMHELDSHYINTIFHSFGIPMGISESFGSLIGGLRLIDIEEYDNGTTYNLTPCGSLVDSILVDFNIYARSHGISHLMTLLQLLSGLSLRIRLYQNGFVEWLKISKIHQFWQFLDGFDRMLRQHYNDQKARFHAIIMQTYHFFAFDEAAMSELDGLPAAVKANYERAIPRIAQTVFSWFLGLQESANEKVSAAVDAESRDRSKRLRTADKLLQKATFTLTTLAGIGTIRVIDTEHNVAGEVRAQIRTVLRGVFVKDKTVYPPIDLLRRVEVAKSAFQQICAAAHLNFGQSLHHNLTARSSGSDQAQAFAITYRDQYVQFAKDVLPNAFFSNAHEMFVAIAAKAGAPSIPAAYMTLPALHALRHLVGIPGCQMIYAALADVACALARDLCVSFVKILNGPPSVYESGIFQAQEASVLIRQLGHVCAVLRLREMVRQFADEVKHVPHEDSDLILKMANSPMQELIENPSTVSLFAALFANPYWETFDYDPGHDAVRDNSHLWGRFFDLFVACAADSRTKITPDLFYRQLFAKIVTSIYKAREHYGKTKKVQYPGLELLILVDHVVSESRYADYSQLENLVPYQLIRTLYTARISRLGP
jgi:hypothetical protein